MNKHCIFQSRVVLMPHVSEGPERQTFANLKFARPRLTSRKELWRNDKAS